MAAAGLTGGHAMDGDGLDAYAALEAEGELPLRIRVAPWCQPDAADADAVAGLVRAQGTGGRLWRVAGVKLFLDGTIDNGTAWLERPDSHGESDRAFWPDPDDTVRRFAGRGVAASMQPTHCCEYTRADHTDNWSRRLGEQRAARGWRCRDLLESGPGSSWVRTGRSRRSRRWA